jgi:hypothetical protein
MSNGDSVRDCSGSDCGYAAFSGEIACVAGDNYFNASLLNAKESNFNDAVLIKATSDVNEILAKIEIPDGKTLALLHTPYGSMLAWVRHDLTVPSDAVTRDSPKEDHKKALGLIDPPPRQPQEQGA